MNRIIVHVDMDAFFASVEQRDDPDLVGKPVIVGGGPGNRGVVSAASYEARRYGIHSAMPTATARRLCPHGVFIVAKHGRYAEASRRVMETLRAFSPLVEPVSIDEAYLDLTGTFRLHGNAARAAMEMKSAIRRATGLCASVGIAPNRLLAKIGSDLNKPDGLTVLLPIETGLGVIASLPVGKIPGIGPKAAVRLCRIGIRTIQDLLGIDEPFAIRLLGERGADLLHLLRGAPDIGVCLEHETKSLSVERTFAQDLTELSEMERILLALCDNLAGRLRRHSLFGHTLHLKMRYSDFRTVIRSRTSRSAMQDALEFFPLIRDLLSEAGTHKPIRLLGVGLSGLVPEEERQMGLFDQKRIRMGRALKASDCLNQRYGDAMVGRAEIHDIGIRGPER